MGSALGRGMKHVVTFVLSLILISAASSPAYAREQAADEAAALRATLAARYDAVRAAFVQRSAALRALPTLPAPGRRLSRSPLRRSPTEAARSPAGV
ncbi:MAG: hypothetical protein AAFU79_03635 [Myxococcota bacterium]